MTKADEIPLKSEMRYYTLFEGANDAIFIMKGDRFVECNQKTLEIFGCGKIDDIIGSTPWDFSPERQPDGRESKEKAFEIIRAALEGKPQRFYWRHVRMDKTPFDAEVSLNCFDWENQKLIQAIVRDITEQKNAQEELRKSEGRYGLIAEKMNDIIWTLDLAMRTTYVSPSVRRVLGFTQEERMAQDVKDQMTGESLNRVIESLAKEMERDNEPGVDPDRTVKVDVEYFHKNGTSVWCENIVGAIRDERGKVTGIHGVSRNITERRHVEEALKKEKERFYILIQNAPFGMLMIDKGGIFTYMNPKFKEIFGYDLKDVPDGKSWFKAAYPDAEYRKDVIRAWVEDLENFNPGEKRPRIYEVTCRDGSRKVINFIPVLLATGENLIACEDITERTNLENQLRQAQKMESVGRLAGGVAHDFNNMLQAIIGYTELSMLNIQRGVFPDANLIQISQAAQRAAVLVRQLLAFARRQAVRPRVLDLNRTVESMLDMLTRVIGEDIELLWKPGADPWPVKIDPVQIDQILANLLVNARDAITGVGRVTIETGNSELDESYCRANLGFVPGEYVRLTVSDSGSGMDKETVSHIFEPFFTTKDIGKGTGLGLAMVYGIVKQNNGFINVQSESGSGTTFKIYLPRCQSRPEIENVAQEQIAPEGAGTILVVEDEKMLLEFVSAILEEQGYSVLAAETPADALKMAFEYKNPIDLLITDVVMPGMNGRDVRDAVVIHYPDIKTIYMSGYTADVIANKGIMEEGSAFLQKPFSINALALKVREVLNG